ncbi:MAG: hypothetical protein WHT09_05985 [Thermogutta sp.]
MLFELWRSMIAVYLHSEKNPAETIFTCFPTYFARGGAAGCTTTENQANIGVPIASVAVCNGRNGLIVKTENARLARIGATSPAHIGA